jgi:WD40 repeat protein
MQAEAKSSTGVLTTGGDENLKLWKFSDFNPLKPFYPQLARQRPPVGDNAVLLWDVHSGQVIRMLVGHDADVQSIAF